MKRYCIKNEKIEDTFTGNNSIIKIAPFILSKAHERYIPSQPLNDIKPMEEKEEQLPDCVRDTVFKLAAKVNGLSEGEYEESLYENLVKDNLPIFPECEAAVMKLFNITIDKCECTSREEEMYGDILQDTFFTVFVELDMYLHIYYTLLYKEKENEYVTLIESDWSKDKKADMRSKRKECKRGLDKAQRRTEPFVINEKSIPQNRAGKTYYDATQIQDFAPNVCRLYYLSSEFRNLFATVKKLDAGKYEFSRIKKIFQEANIKRKEEIWLCEELLGINLSLAFYSFFDAILKDINYTTIEKDFAKVIQGIIKEVMSFGGIYSRCAIVHKLKIMYELKKKSSLYTQYDDPKKHLDYLYKQVLCQYMPECVKHYRYMEYNALNEYTGHNLDKAATIEKLEKDCDILFSKYFEFTDGYYLIEELSKKIENKKLYALIQNIVINN